MVEAKCSRQKHLITWSILLVIYIICLLTTIGRCWDLQPDVNVKLAVVGHRCCFDLNTVAKSSSLWPLSSLMTSTTVKVRLDVAVDFGDGSGLVNYIHHSAQMFQFEHIYKRQGHYVVRVNATDGHLWKTMMVDVKAILLTDLIRLRLPETQVFPVSGDVVVEARVRNITEENLITKFNWDFGDGGVGLLKVLRRNATLEKVSYRYNKDGVFQLHVALNNSLLCQPAIISASQPFIIVEPIQSVSLEILSSDKTLLLSRLKNGTLTTDPVKFAAQAVPGSHMNFTFDFGDETEVTLAGDSNGVAKAAHRYTQEGVYTVCVTVVNAMGSRNNCSSQMVSVERLPEGLRLNRDHYVGRVGERIRLEASVVNNNSNISFDWRLGNDVLLLNAGSAVEQMFFRAGTYLASVTAKTMLNNKNALTAVANISIFDVLLGVKLNIQNETLLKSNKIVISTVDVIELSAQVQPSSANLGRLTYYWKWGNKTGQSILSVRNTFKQSFSTPGWFRLTVTVDNYVSKVTSTALELHVVQLLQSTFLEHPFGLSSASTFLRREIVRFDARHWVGSNLSYEWDFGDGTPLAVSSQSQANHSYQRVGEYKVSVRIWNELSAASGNDTIFVVKKADWCDKPSIRLLGIQENAKIYRREYEDERERESCLWEDKEGDLWMEAAVDSVDCRDGKNQRTLVYSWRLVYDNDRTLLFISDRRWLSVSTNQLPIGNHTLHLKVAINGTIVYSDMKTRFAVVSRPFGVSVVGGSRRLLGRRDNVTLTAMVDRYIARKCRNCTFEWSCKIPNHRKGKCFVDESSYLAFNRNKYETFFAASWLDQHYQSFDFTLSVRRNHLKASALQNFQLTLDEPRSIHVGITCLTCHEGEMVSNYERNIFAAHCYNCPNANVHFEWQLWLLLDDKKTLPISWFSCVQPDGSTFFLHEKKFKNVSTTIKTDDYNFKDDDILANTTLMSRPLGKWRVNISEGLPGEGGSAPGRQNLFSAPTNIRMIRSAHKKFGHQSDYSEQLVHLLNQDTTTDLFQQYLVIKPDILKSGRTYKVVVNARTQVGDGSAVQIINSFKGPHNGRCRISPNSGTMYWTQFSLSCLGWIAEDTQYRSFLYDLRFFKSWNDTSGMLIRLSLDSQLKFVLPAGHQQENYTVFLNVIVHQRGGGSIKICNISLTVFPPPESTKGTIDYLTEELQDQSSKLNSYFFLGDLPSLLQRMHIVTITVNDICQKAKCKQSTKLNIHKMVLKYINALEFIREEEICLLLNIVNEIFQTKMSTAITKMITSIVQRAASIWLTQVCNLRERRIFEEVVLFSKVLNSLITYTTGSSHLKFIRLLEEVISRQLLSFQPVEIPLEFSTESFVVAAVCREIENNRIHLETKWLSLQFSPRNNTVINDGERLCIITSTIFGYFKQEMSIIKFSVYCSNGTEFPLNGIELRSPIISVIPRSINKTKQKTLKSVLMPYSMDVYNFELSEMNRHHTLFVDLKFNFVELDLFPVVLYISFGKLPNIHSYQHRDIITSNKDKFIIVPGEFFDKLGVYSIGITSQYYLSKRLKLRRSNGTINYNLRAEFVECLDYKPNSRNITDQWNSRVLYERIIDEELIYCSFTNLSNYTAKLHNITLHFYRVDTDVLLSEPINLWVFIVLTFIIIGSIVLSWITYKLSIKARHFCGIISAENNSHNDKYSYMMILKSGYHSNAGTTAKVCIALVGDEGISEPRRLVSSNEYEYSIAPGATCSFLITTRQKLGNIRKIKIWHDYTGGSPDFFIRYLKVTDLETGRKYHFSCNRWLSIIKEEGEIEMEFVAKYQSLSRYKIFMETFEEYYFKYSVWNISRGDHFTLQERIFGSYLIATTSALAVLLWNEWFNVQKRQNIFERFSYQSLFIATVIGTITYGFEIIYSALLHCIRLSSCQLQLNTSVNWSKSSFDLDQEIINPLKLQKWVERKWSPSVVSDFSSVSGVSSETIHHDSDIGKFQTELDDLKNIGKIRWNCVTPLSIWWRHLVRTIYLGYFGTTLICTFYFAVRFSTASLSTFLEIMISSIVIGHVISYPTMVALIVTSTLLVTRWQRREMSTSCACGVSNNCNSEKTGNSENVTRLSNYTNQPIGEVELSKLKTIHRKKTRINDFIRKFTFMLCILLLLLLLITEEGNTGTKNINKAIKRSFQRKYSLHNIKQHKDWLIWVEKTISELSQQLISIDNKKTNLWKVPEFDSIIIGDFLVRTELESHDNNPNRSIVISHVISRNRVDLVHDLAVFKQSSWNATVFKSDFYTCLYNYPSSYLNILKLEVQLCDDVIMSKRINVISLKMEAQEKLFLSPNFTSLTRVILSCIVVIKTRRLLGLILVNWKKVKLFRIFLKIILYGGILSYMGFHLYISNCADYCSTEIESGYANITEILNLANLIEIKRSFFSVVYFFNILYLLNVMSIFWSSTMKKGIFILKCVWIRIFRSFVLKIILICGFSSLVGFWGVMKSASLSSPSDAAYTLILLITRTLRPTSEYINTCFERNCIAMFVLLFLVSSYLQFKSIVATLRNNVTTNTISDSSDLGINDILSYFKLKTVILFQWNCKHTPKLEEKNNMKIDYNLTECEIQLLESQMEDLLIRLEKHDGWNSFNNLSLDDCDDVFGSEEVFYQSGVDQPSTSYSSDAESDFGEPSIVPSDKICWPVSFQNSTNNRSFHHGLRRTKTQGKGLHPNDLEIYRFDSNITE